MAGNGSATWTPLKRSGSFHVPGEFEMLMLVLWRYQYTHTTVELTDEWSNHYWNVTQGVPDIMVKLWVATQEAAITTKSEVLTHELIDVVFASQFAMVSLPLKALRENNDTVLSMIPDLSLSRDTDAAHKRERKKTYVSPTPAPLNSAASPNLRSGKYQMVAERVQGGVLE
jgi:hypothetical protein